MHFNKKVLFVALAAALPWIGAHAQSNADLLRQIEALKAQLEALTAKVEAVSKQSGGVNSQEFNRLVQKVELAEENSIASGFKGMKFKGVIEAAYINDRNSTNTGFNKALGNGGYGGALFEVAKESEESVGWTLRLMPLSGTGSIVHEASVSVPIGDNGTKLIAGLVPDFSGYEYTPGNQNPLVTNNLLFANAASNYTGVGMSYVIGKSWTAKWMLAQVDGVASRKAPGFVYRADYSAGEYSGLGFSGVHFRTNTAAAVGKNADLLEIDAYHTRGDLTLQGQFSVGRLIAGGLDGLGGDARWWGLSGLVGYKVTPRLQALSANLLRPGVVARQEQQTREAARHWLSFVGLSELEQRPARILSGGQRKLLELARVMVAQPKLVLLDEPAAGVNPALLDQIVDKVATLNARGTTFLIIEHNMDVVASLCHTVMVMAQGSVLARGDAHSVLRDPRVVDAYLGDAA